MSEPSAGTPAAELPDLPEAPDPAGQPRVPDPADRLLELGAVVTEPDPEAELAARARLADGDGADDLGGFGRLGELAVWWASVVGAGRPARPPAEILLVGGGEDVASRRPGARALALPRGGSVDDALEWGLGVADRAADLGTDLVVLCVDDATPWRALAADLLGMDAVEASGWPDERGQSDEAWMDEVAGLRDRLRDLRGLRAQPSDLLRALGSPSVAAATAVLVGSTARRTPVLLDGPGAAAVALLGVRVNYAAPRWWQAAHRGSDRLHERILGSLGVEALTGLGIRRVDGTASLVALALLDAAAALLDDVVGLDDGYGDDGLGD